ncbi:MAG: NADH-quinone oxidoreductase subunit A [Planctomycetota bacterium]
MIRVPRGVGLDSPMEETYSSGTETHARCAARWHYALRGPFVEIPNLPPLFVYGAILVGFVITNLLLAHMLGPRKRTPVKDMPYESGMDPVGDARSPFDVRFYLVAILFLVFDVELLFLYPWAVSAYSDLGIPPELRDTVFGVMLIFMATLALAWVYAWRKGVFRWR